MAATQQKFDIGIALRSLYEDIPYVRKVGYSVDEIGRVITVRVVYDDTDNADDYHARAMLSIERCLDFENQLPEDMKNAYYVQPLASPPTPGGMDHFGRMTAVLDR